MRSQSSNRAQGATTAEAFRERLEELGELREEQEICGDEIKITLDLDGDTVHEIEFSGRGCSISQSSASMLTEMVQGLSLEEAAALAAEFKRIMQGAADFDEEALGDLAALLGVRKFPMRIKCATLAWNTLQQGLKEYAAKRA